MAIFDRLQNLSIGQYIPADSIIHRLDPRVKITAFFLLTIAVTLTPSLLGLLAASLITVLLLRLSRIPLKNALSKLAVPLPMIILLALLQFLIAPRVPEGKVFFSYQILTISAARAYAAGMLCLRFITLVWLFTIAGASTSSIELIYGFDLIFKPLQKLGIHTYTLTMTIQMMLRFIPYLIFNAEKIAKAQAARGARWDDPRGGLVQRAKQILPLILPLINTGLQQADTLAQAMLARGYGTASRRTGLREYHLHQRDVIFLFFTLVAAIVIIWLPQLQALFQVSTAFPAFWYFPV